MGWTPSLGQDHGFDYPSFGPSVGSQRSWRHLGTCSNSFCVLVQVPSPTAYGWGLSRLQAPQRTWLLSPEPLKQKPRLQTKGCLLSSPPLVTSPWLWASLRGPGPLSQSDRGQSKLPGGMGISGAQPERPIWELDLRSLSPICRHSKGGQEVKDGLQVFHCLQGDAEGFMEGRPGEAQMQGTTYR